jgi:hypothetical protein
MILPWPEFGVQALACFLLAASSLRGGSLSLEQLPCKMWYNPGSREVANPVFDNKRPGQFRGQANAPWRLHLACGTRLGPATRAETGGNRWKRISSI